MNNSTLQAMMQFMRLLPDESLSLVADARYTFEPRDYKDKVILQLAAGEWEWRQECRTMK
jgi:hypothetical protein